MGLAAAFAVALAALPLLAPAQERPKDDPNRTRVEVTGCVKGSTLTENPARRWRLRGPKPLMRDLKKQAGSRLLVAGTTKNPHSGIMIGSTRVGRTNIYIGNNPGAPARDPLPEQPTIDVESFKPTGEKCD